MFVSVPVSRMDILSKHHHFSDSLRRETQETFYIPLLNFIDVCTGVSCLIHQTIKNLSYIALEHLNQHH